MGVMVDLYTWFRRVSDRGNSKIKATSSPYTVLEPIYSIPFVNTTSKQVRTRGVQIVDWMAQIVNQLSSVQLLVELVLKSSEVANKDDLRASLSRFEMSPSCTCYAYCAHGTV